MRIRGRRARLAGRVDEATALDWKVFPGRPSTGPMSWAAVTIETATAEIDLLVSDPETLDRLSSLFRCVALSLRTAHAEDEARRCDAIRPAGAGWLQCSKERGHRGRHYSRGLLWSDPNPAPVEGGAS